jgi:DNA-binding SARP family transcriptional activator/tetratricopeptide (TPR) repeat protein
MRRLEVRLLGAFEVLVDSQPVAADAWPQRRAVDLVKLLALAPGHRMPRDAVLEALWPRLGADAAARNLHNAASHTRRALRGRDAIVLRGGVVLLAPDAEVIVDVDRFERGDESAYDGELLPDDRYETWTLGARARLRERRLVSLRSRQRWEEVLREDPADEEAHSALVRAHVASGNRRAAARQFRLLREELGRLGAEPSEATLALEPELMRGPPVRATVLLRGSVEGRGRARRWARRASPGCGGQRRSSACHRAARDREDASDRGCPRGGGAARFSHLRGAVHEAEGRAPYAPLVEALDPLVAGRPEFAAALSDSARSALARLLPAVPSARSSDERVDRHRVFSAVAQLLAQASAERGVVLAIDDMHAADEATAALVHYLARSAAAERLLVVGGMRDAPSSAAVAVVRASLLERGSAVEVVLGPLERTALRAVAKRAAVGLLPPAAVSQIERLAAGNPLFAEELATAVDASGEIAISGRLREVVTRRIQQLAPLGERLLAVLAVIDDGFTRADLVALVGAEGVDDALSTADRAGVVECVRGRYRFRHTLVREELTARLPEEALRGAHADAAARLIAEDAPPETVAHHLLRARREREAVPLLTHAAEWAAAVGAYRDGAEWAELALGYADDPERPDLLALRAQLLHGAGEAGATLAYDKAIAVAPAQRVPALRAQQARAFLAAGDVRGAGAVLEGVRAERQEDFAELVLLRGMVARHTGDWETARQLAREAERLAPNPTELAALKGMVAHLDGSWEQHSRRQLTHVWESPELAGRVVDAYLCVTEYVLTAGAPTTESPASRSACGHRRTGQVRAAGRPSLPPCSARLSFSSATSRQPARISPRRRDSVGRSARSESSRSRVLAWARRSCTGATVPARGRSSSRRSSSRTSRLCHSICCSTCMAPSCRSPTRTRRHWQ